MAGEPIYNFEMVDEKLGLHLNDGGYTIIVNTKCSQEKIPQKLRPLFSYINEAKNSGDSELVDRIDERVRKFSTDEWRRRQMTFEYYVKEKEKIAYRNGEEIGRNEGEQIGLERGAAQKEREIAKNMKNKQIDFKTIFEITGLSIAEIEAL